MSKKDIPVLRAFRGKKLIVIERRPSLTMACHAQLIAAGAIIAGPATSLEQVLNLLEAGAADGAIIDVEVDAEMMLHLGLLLESMATPFVFASFTKVNPDGYALSGDTKHLRKIADALFGPPGTSSTLH
ncbi:hypothetical protein [Agrobacterium pusense]|jgi:hypothetical protein|uniref:hypothetical protein n=1 Tax=Agrobacterium pusense TaxID=648995 RepID=UPI0021CE5401|nr:hypothetical protein [Agrobacterium pusense]